MVKRTGGAAWPLCPLVIVLSSFPPTSSYQRLAQFSFETIDLRSRLDSFSRRHGLPRFAKKVSSKRKLPAARDSARGFLSRGFGAHRQLRMYAQIFQSARKISKKNQNEEFSACDWWHQRRSALESAGRYLTETGRGRGWLRRHGRRRESWRLRAGEHGACAWSPTSR
jgi:hypothetical protein